ncbi:hypothetical protein Goari_001237 [Gossypium aridum]|uniref:Uncharacterized protein n=1 Tax=Gossypium aridum TaxID=34290 RepID=A0A7J8YKS8_GOSAI|nr:hypothetical protein [Gossypium aridum]
MNEMNTRPLIPTGNVNDVLDKWALEVTRPISKSCGNNPVRLSSISSRPVEVYSVGVEHIEKPHVAGPSCKNSVVVRDRKEVRIPVSIFRSDNPRVVTFKENNDPNAGKHSVVTFKENNDPNGGRLRSGEDHIRGCDRTIFSKGRGQGVKGGQIGSGRRLNWTIRDRRERFKLAKNYKISLTESMGSITELISAQFNMKFEKVFGNIE